MIQLMQGDCLDLMQVIPDQSVDLILCDLPYGTTACKWDTVIPFDALWKQYLRIIKDDCAIILMASQPFTTHLAASNLKTFRYSLVWDKKFSGNFVQAKRMPLKTHEDILVFSKRKGLPTYFPEMVKREMPIKAGRVGSNGDAIPNFSSESAKRIVREKIYEEKYPISILEFSNRGAGDRGSHPTQKPVALMEYLIKTYTKEGMTVLDNCMGSGTTGVACVNTKRKFIGIEKYEKYFQIAKNRIEKASDE